MDWIEHLAAQRWIAAAEQAPAVAPVPNDDPHDDDELDELLLDRLHDPAGCDGWEQSIIVALAPPAQPSRNGREVEER